MVQVNPEVITILLQPPMEHLPATPATPAPTTDRPQERSVECILTECHTTTQDHSPWSATTKTVLKSSDMTHAMMPPHAQKSLTTTGNAQEQSKDTDFD